MEEPRLDNELERIKKKFPFLWENYNFHIKYLTRDFGMYYTGFVFGIENELCKLIFMKESSSSVEPIKQWIGKKSALLVPPNYSYFVKDGWYPLPGLIYWLSGVECERDKNVDQDLDNISQYLKHHMDKVLDLFRYPAEFDKKLEYYRNMHKDEQITVEKIREERARLQALGQDSSLEAALASLRGGRK